MLAALFALILTAFAAGTDPRPGYGHLPPDPYAQTDFTAYSLEGGEIRLTPGAFTAGLGGRIQVGTVPALDVLGLWNGSAKWNIVRLGPVDVAASGALAMHSEGDASQMLYASGAGHLSLVIVPAWSIHASVRYHHVAARGIPSLPAAFGWFGLESDPEKLAAIRSVEPPSVKGIGWTAQFATDVRFSRRDSLVLRVKQVPQANLGGNLGGFALAGTTGDVNLWSKPLSMTDLWVATLAYQATWRAFQFRIGAGTTSDPALRLIPVADVSLWLGGPTRHADALRVREWRLARRAAASDSVAAVE